MNEVIEERKIYRVLTDKATKTWTRTYLQTNANSVLFDDGMYAEEKLGDIKGISTQKRGVEGYAMDASVAEIAPLELVGTLYEGQTSLSWTSAKIDDSCIIQVFTDMDGLVPVSKMQTGTTFTVTFKPQLRDVNIIVHVHSR